MAKLKKILILMNDTGFGHRSAANAIAAALQENYGSLCKVNIVNPLDDPRTPTVLRESQSDYDKMVRQMPDIYKLRYQISDTQVPNSIMESAFTVMLYTIIQEILKRYQPDVIVTTHPMFPAPLRAVIATSKLNIPVITVVTDLVNVHRMWFNDGAELICVPTKYARVDALEYDIPEEKIQVTGVPVNPSINQETRDTAALRAELGWQADVTTALVVGSKRVNNLPDVLHILNHSGFPVQWAIVAGGDDHLYEWMQNTEWHGFTHLYNYVENLAPMMCASDLILSKAGGLIVTEALACGLPLLFVDATPGQEEGNADYVIQNNAGEWAKTPLETLEILCHWLANDRRLLQERARAAKALGRPRAAYTISDFIWSAAERGPLPIPANRKTWLPKLLELLVQFDLSEENSSGGDRTEMV
jgi:1,2-diacylglycerol 3-beta-galactosyltransferase